MFTPYATPEYNNKGSQDTVHLAFAICSGADASLIDDYKDKDN